MLRVIRPLVGVTLTCKGCGEEKDESLFPYSRGKRVGLKCRVCAGKLTAEWARRNPEKAVAKAKRYAERNPDYAGRWLRNNPGAGARIQADYRRRNPDASCDYYLKKMAEDPEYAMKQSARQRLRDPVGYSQYSKEWRQKNRDKLRVYEKIRRTLLKQRTPKWADLEEIMELYRQCPAGYEVDHIVPLRGKTVSGLHVRNNLQYLTVSQNRSKGAKFTDFQPAGLCSR